MWRLACGPHSFHSYTFQVQISDGFTSDLVNIAIIILSITSVWANLCGVVILMLKIANIEDIKSCLKQF